MDISELNLFAPKEKQLRNKGFDTVESLLWSFPRRYDDFTALTTLLPLSDGETITGAFLITGHKLEQSNWDAKPSWVRMAGNAEGSGLSVSVFWMGQRLSFNTFAGFESGQKYLICGKAKYNAEYNSFSISSPSVFTPYSPEKLCLHPVYRAVPGMADSYFRDVIKKALSFPVICGEPYPTAISEKYGYPCLDQALREIHVPSGADTLGTAQNRVIFDSLLQFSLQLQYAQSHYSKGSQYNLRSMELVTQIRNGLPYELTADQISVLDDAFEKMRNGQRLHALIQGDVGSGKTIVAALLMAAMVDSGFQCALMAPSKVLAQQHFNDMKSMFEPLGIDVVLCLSGVKAAEKKRIANGAAKIVVGTHAVLSATLQFKDLALVIVDEEHRFGVAQRKALVDKASAGVHSVTMSATPIPRSLAEVVYGQNVQLYTIKTMPKGRTPVATFVRSNIDCVLPAVERQLAAGHQAFIVCPSIDSTEKFDGASVTEISGQYRSYLEPRGYKVATLTGKDKKSDTEEIIRAFAAGETHVLVATTVIEVGVNIPNATVIVVHDADFFGLSTLHQLRGRVGRSNYQSYCVLVSSNTKNERLQLMKETNSGFDIAKADLNMRGPGDLLGSAQKGQAEPIELMLAYPEIYDQARQEATDALRAGADWPIVHDAIKDADQLC